MGLDQSLYAKRKNRPDAGLGYWRKANHIHDWFIKNCANGVDDCNQVRVSLAKLRELKSICEKVKKEHGFAEILLPTQSGFFFGGIEYDEYYFREIDDTIKILNEALEMKGIGWKFYYHASW